MRTSVLVVVALAALASPAFAQDRTLPAGDYLLAQPPIDRVAAQPLTPSTVTLEGRSVGADAAPAATTRSHRRY